MRQGRPIVDVLREVQAQAAAKRDYIVPTQAMTMTTANTLQVKNTGEFDITPHTHSQIAERIDIPTKYYDRMKDSEPDLLATNVNRWFQKQPEKRMLRTLTVERPAYTVPPVLPATTGIARAFLGSGYRRLDNFDLANAILPFMMNEYDKPLSIESCELTDTRLYIKVIAPHTERDINTLLAPGTHRMIGEPVRSGFIVQNSEIGMGAISVFPFTMVLRCTNGLVVEELGQRKYHAGKRNQGNGDEDNFLLSDETRALDDAAFWSRVKDTIKACLTDETVIKIFRKMAEARDIKIEKPPEETVELLGNNYGLSEGQRTSVLRALIDSGQGLTKYGLANALTTMAQDADLDYNEASRVEVLGGRILNLSPSEWKVLAA